MDSGVQEKRGFFSKIPGKLRWLIVALVFNNIAIGYLLIYLTAFFPELGIGAGVVGLLLGLEGAMVLLSIPLGTLSDRRGRKKLLLIGTSLVPLPIILIALTVNIAILVVAAIILGIAESAALSTWNAIVADQTSLENRDASFLLSFILGNGAIAFGFLLPTLIPTLRSLTGLDSIIIHQDTPGFDGTGLSHHAPLAVPHPQGLQGNSQPYKADQRQEFPDSPQVLRNKQPNRTRSRIHHSPDSNLALPQIRNPRPLQRTPALTVQPNYSARRDSKS
jgi:hypothetical protein